VCDIFSSSTSQSLGWFDIGDLWQAVIHTQNAARTSQRDLDLAASSLGFLSFRCRTETIAFRIPPRGLEDETDDASYWIQNWSHWDPDMKQYSFQIAMNSNVAMSVPREKKNHLFVMSIRSRNYILRLMANDSLRLLYTSFEWQITPKQTKEKNAKPYLFLTKTRAPSPGSLAILREISLGLCPSSNRMSYPITIWANTSFITIAA